jgi:Haem-binding domain
MGRWSRAAVGTGAVLLLIQVVPYGRNHSNPPVTGTPSWASPRTRELAQRACFDCHSHETRWPWYASIAPVSWRIQHDVDEGRSHLDFSAFDHPQQDARDAAEEVEKGDMPPFDYRWMHAEARLTDEERTELVRGLTSMFGRRERGAGRDDE